MKKIGIGLYKYIFLLAFGLIGSSYANDIDAQIKSVISGKINSSAGASRIMCANKLRCSLALTTQQYNQESSTILWSHNGKILPNANQLIEILQNSYKDALYPEDYHLSIINQLTQQVSSAPMMQPPIAALADLDTTLTDAFLLYAKHMATGRVDNLAVYPTWTISKRAVNLPDLLQKATHGENVTRVLNGLTPTYPGYLELKSQLEKYQNIASNGGWGQIAAGASLKLGSKGVRVSQLQKRLTITGEYSATEKKAIFDKQLKEAVMKFQTNHGLKANGIVDKQTLQALNIPVNQVIKLIELNMDRLRWLPLQTSNQYLLVNIPNFSLNVMESGQTTLSMPVIVGKGANRSCVLSSKISYIEINPYWSVPDSIGRKEILPKLQQDPSYLAKEQMNVYNGSFANPPVDPSKINWKKVDPNNMPYKFRQMPGEKNALGHIKFIFPNVCGIYLHDTPTRNLFGRNRRDFSHGCIRVGKPIELADYLLSDKPNWDGDRVESQIASGKRQIVYLAEPMDVNIIYGTVWVDNKGELQFRNDIYQIDNVDYPVYLPKESSVTEAESDDNE